MGVIFALVALVGWGFGDFLIQKTTRRFGDFVVLFYIGVFGTVVLLPFIYRELWPLVLTNSLGFFILITASLILTVAALCDFEAFKRGKLSVVEPINAFELPITAILAFLILREALSGWQIIFLVLVIVGIFLVSIRSWRGFKKIHLEKGVWLAVAATVGMGASDFLVGVGARQTSPLLVNWFLSVFAAIVSLIYLLFKGRTREIITDFRDNKLIILILMILDNIAWVAFAYSMYFIPIAIAGGISEGYTALTAGLGILVNKEKLQRHQFVGLFLTLTAVIVLAVVSE